MKLPRPRDRIELLNHRRNEKMARSAHAYVRGNTVQFYDWLHSQRGRRLPHGPGVWICGDAAAPRAARAHMPRDNARRVVEGARQLSPALGERMLATRFLEHGVFIRELLPQDMKLELDTLNEQDATLAAAYLASIVGIAHARQMDDASRKSWLSELQLNRSKNLDAPSWLWTSVVQLVGSHEEGYLEHCRRYALEN